MRESDEKTHEEADEESQLDPAVLPHIRRCEAVLADLTDSEEDRPMKEAMTNLVESLRKRAKMGPLRRLRLRSTFNR